MYLTGHVYSAIGTDADFTIRKAVVTPSRISIDWNEDGDIAHLKAASQDGIHFQGHYGYPVPDSDCEVELTLYQAKGEFLLFGIWWEHRSGRKGTWVFRLQRGTSTSRHAKRQIYCCPGADSYLTIRAAVVTPKRISIDWDEDGEFVHIHATSPGGIHFEGNYGHPTLNSDYEFKLSVFRALDEYLLFGKWCDRVVRNEGIWVFRLQSATYSPRQPKKARRS